MYRHPLLRGIASATLAALVVAIPVLADPPQDAWITTQIKIELLTDPEVDGLSVDVDTSDGYVTLHGSVASNSTRHRAVELAQGVEGVRGVHDLLSVAPEAVLDTVELSDSVILQHVAFVLAIDPALEGDEIGLKTVEHGVVVLTGRADTLSAHRRALEIARGVEGVRRVVSRIQSPKRLTDLEIWHGGEPDSMPPELAALASDAWITTEAKIRLMALSGISPRSVGLDTRFGIVTLFGRVPSADRKRAVEREIQKIAAVAGVENELRVAREVAVEGPVRPDDQLRLAVRSRLSAREALRDSAIDVEVSDGVVRLSGTVSDVGDEMQALTVARHTEGVESVVDNLRVRDRRGS